MSDGIESYPHEWTMRAPVAVACSPNLSMENRTNGTSPVRST